jgi:hypothetical protein
MIKTNLRPRQDRRTSFAALCALLLVPLMSIGMYAQSNYGSIQGSVHDASGAFIPNATVTVTAVGTNEVRTVQTNKKGEYDVEALQPVLYRVSFEAPGFKQTTVENVKVDTSKSATVNETLKVGAVQDVSVTAASSQLQTEDGTDSFTIDQRTIQDMPLNGRNTLSLALTLPGASGNAGSEYGGIYANAAIPGRELIINGGRSGTSQFVADGQNVTSPGLARTTVSFSPDSIQEFTVLESNFSAQYAQAGGAIIQQTTRGGTNELHGDAYEFYRTRAFQAVPFDTYANPVVGNPAPPLIRNQLGIVVGGPVVIPKVYNGRNKTFFFASFEPTRINQGYTTPTFERVPTAEEAQGNFCDSLVYKSSGISAPYPVLYNHFTPNPGGGLLYAPNPNYSAAAAMSATNPEYAYDFTKNMFDPVGANCANGPGHRLVDANGVNYLNPASSKLVGYYEKANIPMITSGSNAGGNYEYYTLADVTDNRYSFRIDQVLPRNNTIFVRTTIEPVFTNRFGRDTVMEPMTSDASRAKQILLSETAVIRPNIVNNVLVGYNGGDFARNFPANYQSTDGTTPIFGSGGTPNPLGYGIANFFNASKPIGESIGYGTLGMSGIQNVSRDKEHTYTASDDLTWSRGQHTFHLGVLGMVQQSNEAGEGAGYLAGGKFSFYTHTNDKTDCYSGNITITAKLANGNTCSNDSSTGDIYAAFLEGVPSNITFQDNLAPTYYYRWFSIGSYVQDDFKVLPNLTLNFGLRHQYQSPRWEKYNRQGELNLNDLVTSYAGKPSPVFDFVGFNGRSRYLDPPQYFDFEPRFGFSWAIHPGSPHNIVLRGGYGFTHDILTGRSRVPFPDLAEGNYSGFRAINPVSGNNGSYNYTNVAGCGWASCQDNFPGQFQYNNVQWLPDPNLFKIPSSGTLTNQLDTTLFPGQQYPYDARYADTGDEFASDFKTPYVQNFSLQVQTQLDRSTVLTIGWQGNKGTKLFSTPYDINNNPVTMTTQFPGYTGKAGSNGVAGMILLEDATHSGSIYHALIANLDRRFTNGLQFDVNYTFSKSLDDSSGGIENDPSGVGGQDSSAQTIMGNTPQTSYGTTYERSVSTFDTPHVFNATAFYELPFGRGKRYLNHSKWLDAGVGGWQVTTLAHITSGQATFLQLGDEDRLDDYIGGGSNYNPRPNIVPGIPLKNPDWSHANANTVPYLNPRAFTFQGPAQFGNSPRMISGLRLPPAKQIDASVFKTFYPFENRKRNLVLRFEFFNVLNWRSYGISGVSTNLTNGINQNAYGQANRYANLTPGVWNTFLHGGCSTVSSVPVATGTVDSASTVCNNLSAIYNSSFWVLGQSSQNTLTPRVLQVAAKFYF